MNSKEFITGLKANWPVSLHPTEYSEKDLIRTLRTLHYNPNQLQKIYDEVLKECEYFPKIHDIIRAANKFCFPTSEKKSLPDPVFKYFEKDGYSYAKKIENRYPETREEEQERWNKEAISVDEARRLGYIDKIERVLGIRIDSVKDLHMEIKPMKQEQKLLADYDDSDEAIASGGMYLDIDSL